MATYEQKWAWWGARSCGEGRIDVTFMGRSPVRIQPEMVNAVKALERAFLDNGYQMPIGVTGSYSCRKIGGTDTWSLHAIPIAIDVDYGNNPYLREEIPRGFDRDSRFLITEEQIDAVEAIVNSEGTSIWKWLGWTIGDIMHVEIDVPPDKCEPVVDAPPVDQAPNIGETKPHQTAAWQKAYDFDNSLINVDTHPQDLLSKGDFYTLMERHGFYN